MSFLGGRLVDTRAHDLEIRVVVLQPQGGSERVRVSRLDENDVGFAGGEAVEEGRLVA